jgi:hypothetical protein
LLKRVDKESKPASETTAAEPTQQPVVTPAPVVDDRSTSTAPTVQKPTPAQSAQFTYDMVKDALSIQRTH